MAEPMEIPMSYNEPDLKGLIDEDILDRFKDVNVLWGDIINAQLIKTNKELIEQLKKGGND